MNLYLDDLRKPSDTYPNDNDWVLVTTVAEAIQHLETGNVKHISLDHDLGDDDEIGTGYDVVLWIEENVALAGFNPPKISIHSANPVGRAKMQKGIDSIMRYCNRHS